MSAGVISSAALNKGGDSLLESVIGSLLQGIPSKKNSSIHKKIKLLKKEDWFKEFVQRNGNLFFYNHIFRDFIYKEDIENILKEESKIKAFQKQLKQVVMEEVNEEVKKVNTK